MSRCSSLVTTSSAGGAGLGETLEGALIEPETPCDASEPIGERDGGLVVAAAELDAQGPALESVGLVGPVSGEERRAGAVGEQHTEVGVASLGDAAEAASVPR